MNRLYSQYKMLMSRLVLTSIRSLHFILCLLNYACFSLQSRLNAIIWIAFIVLCFSLAMTLARHDLVDEGYGYFFYTLDWFYETIRASISAFLTGDSNLIAIVAITACTCLLIFFENLSTLSTKQQSSSSMDLQKKHLPSVLRLIMVPKTRSAATLMFSYSWNSMRSKNYARSLSYVLPDVWIDICRLVSGVNVQVIIVSLNAFESILPSTVLYVYYC